MLSCALNVILTTILITKGHSQYKKIYWQVHGNIHNSNIHYVKANVKINNMRLKVSQMFYYDVIAELRRASSWIVFFCLV